MDYDWWRFDFRITARYEQVVWPGGKAPSDNPECGFNNELCEWLLNGLFGLFSRSVTTNTLFVFTTRCHGC